MTPPFSFSVDADIARAEALPGAAYSDPAFFAAVRERVLARAWHLYPAAPPGPGELAPWTLCDEPLLWANDGERLRCLSNVCTHRGAILISEACAARAIRCPYHGRKFGVDGRCTGMPGFEVVPDFPAARDHLPEIAVQPWYALAFASLAPAVPVFELLAPVAARIGWLPLAAMKLEPPRVYEFAANWALYCDNYLEGLHIPFVHRALAKTLDLGGYRVDTVPHGSVQVGIAAEGEPALEPPAGHPDHGRRVAGYYFWLFPSTMLNVYPWGMSINVVEPLAVDRTRVHYLFAVWDAAARGGGASADLHQVELEDEAIVASVQRGVAARLYRRGRYAPVAERAVHHFHRLLLAALQAP